MIFINDTSLKSINKKIVKFDHPSNDIFQKINFFIYHNSNNDIWNSNSNINIRYFNHFLLNIILEKMTYKVSFIILLYIRHHKCRYLPEKLKWNMASLLRIFVPARLCLPSLNITLNVGYYFKIYSIQWKGDIYTTC